MITLILANYVILGCVTNINLRQYTTSKDKIKKYLKKIIQVYKKIKKSLFILKTIKLYTFLNFILYHKIKKY